MLSDLEFVLELRDTVARYLRAVDGWESAYRKFARRTSYQPGLTPELDQAQAEYKLARKALEASVPRARRVGLRHGARDPWAGLLRYALGQTTLGRNERLSITTHLESLIAACEDERPGMPGAPPVRPTSWLHRVKNYFV